VTLSSHSRRATRGLVRRSFVLVAGAALVAGVLAAPAAADTSPRNETATGASLTGAANPMSAEPLPAETGGIVPAPVEQTAGAGDPFELTASSRIMVSEGKAMAAGNQLAKRLRTATGFALPVRQGTAGSGDIAMVLADPESGASQDYQRDAAYRLTASAPGVTIAAATRTGLQYASSTLLQLLPPWAMADRPYDVAWTVAPTTVVDYPRYAERGLMIDPARNFLTVPEVRRVIDQLNFVKANRLHIHLTDDQGWRIQIDSWPNLTAHGGTGSMAGGQSGFYTKDDFRAIVAYAAERGIEVIPEIDIPGHVTAALSSYPQLSCDDKPVPLRTTGGVSTYSLCVSEESTYQFVHDVLTEVAEISPSPYVHIGGDEAAGTSDADYETFINRVDGIVRSLGKTMVGWTPIPKAGVAPDVVQQYWADRTRAMNSSWFAGDRPVLLSPTSYAYLDYGFAPGQTLGWKYTNKDTAAAYSLDPSAVVDETTRRNINQTYGIQEKNILGIEGAIWGEKLLRGGPDLEYLVWPRLAALMERAWSPQDKAGDFTDFGGRLGQLGARLHIAGTNLWPDPKVPWATTLGGLDLSGPGLSVNQKGVVDGPVASLSSLAFGPTGHTAAIDWGDGVRTDGTITGAGAAMSTTPQVGTVSGSHRYAASGTYTGTVTVTLASGNMLRTPFTVRVR